MKKEYSSSWKSNLLLSVVSLIFVILVLETVIRAYDMISGHGFFSDHRNLLARSIRPVRPFRNFGFNLYKEENGTKYIISRHDELFPIKKPNGTFRIVVFGGSTTENYTPFKEAFMSRMPTKKSITRTG